jgi:hypothetical protein
MKFLEEKKSEYSDGTTKHYHATRDEALKLIRNAPARVRFYAHVDVAVGIDADLDHFYRHHTSVPLTRPAAKGLIEDVMRNAKPEERVIVKDYVDGDYRAIYFG